MAKKHKPEETQMEIRITGYAACGKTTAINAIVEVLEREGFTVEAFDDFDGGKPIGRRWQARDVVASDGRVHRVKITASVE